MTKAMYPNDLRYTKDHEWARVEDRNGQKLVTVGITRFAVDLLGDVTQIDLPKEGESIKCAEVFGSVESVKAVSDLFAPLSGKVMKVNSSLSTSPEQLNDDPYDRGWMIQVAATNPQELALLMDADVYRSFLFQEVE
jgi:glycine cleavage system H protein